MRLPVDKKYDLKSDNGTVLMEAIICLPVLLLLSLGVAQFAHIWYCRTIVHYAAYCGARATLTAPNGAANELTAARSAVETVCAPIAFMNPTDEDDFSLPGVTPASSSTVNSAIEGSGAVRFKHNNNSNHANNVLQVSVSMPSAWHRQVDVTMKVPLLIPFAGQVIGKLMSLWNDNAEFDIRADTPDGTVIQLFSGEWTSRICLRERAYIVKPFVSTWSSF